ncbi:NUDIX domain-containing protein [Paracoccus sp. S-4012]|uniref:NUDIX domain-containing protein n=1 Tax=Paracoccus sp. S-4012 TaxID=2665648 RepID=UPI0012B10AF5|nr:NUDIX domain-containing protein [Paracoccus sp. S-4012]MRX51327.1 NUDIX domain-containing protein [Paracoccus sp. S-4012]
MAAGGEAVLLVGVLAGDAMAEALGLEGERVALTGRLGGGGRAGVEVGGWPVLLPGSGEVPARRVAASEGLDRYAAVFGLEAVETPAGPGLGLSPRRGEATASVTPPDHDLAAAIAGEILAAPPGMTADALRRRLPQIAVAAASRLRGAAERRSDPGGLLPPVRPDNWRLVKRRMLHAGHFAVEELDLVHRRHDGRMGPRLTREVFVAGDAVTVLPWDPARDRVLVIDQFRAAVAARGEAQPWMLEPIAGRIDPGETPAETAIREAEEEAGLNLDPARLVAGPAGYASPGSFNEYIYSFIALCDLPDDAGGLGGLETEAEDIRAHLLPRAALTRMARAGELPNSPLTLLALWLALEASGLQRRAGTA